jgi:threonine synthase
VSEARGTVYASHLWHPAFVLGVTTLAFELWEQRHVPPDSIVMPVGAGTLLLGIAGGFERLQAAGLVHGVPRLIGVQTRRCAPIASRLGAIESPALSRPSVAEGIQVADPPRADEILGAIDRSGGTALAVDDPAIVSKVNELARGGLLVEPTSAVAFVGLDRARADGLIAQDEDVVVVSTGSGLKALMEPPLPSVSRERKNWDRGTDRET